MQIKNLISIWSDANVSMQFPSVGILLPAIKSRPYSLAHLMLAVARQGDLKQSLYIFELILIILKRKININ